MGVSWTPEQKKVIDLRDRNILVSAAAGSGKTAVLVERIKERILDPDHPVDIDEMLVVTFTNAAAAQMRDRVGIAIENELLEHPGNLRFSQQLALVHNAQITTIDSFCLYVIRNHFHEIDLEPNFRIADEGELKLLKQDVMERLLEGKYQEADEDFLKVADIYASGRNDNGLKELLLQLYEFAQSYPWPKDWLENSIKSYQIRTESDFESSDAVRGMMAYLHHVLEGILQKMDQCLALCEDDDGPYMYEQTIYSDRTLVEGLLSGSTYRELSEAMQKMDFVRLASSRGFQGDTAKLDYVKDARADWKKLLQKGIQEKYFFCPLDQTIEQYGRLEKTAETLVDLTIAFMDALMEQKRKKNLVDFADLEHFALEILVDKETRQPTETAKEFQNAYAEIMIDEYQDSNYVQETILRAISRESRGENNLFMVGDVKQSIYRFRLARPELFMEKYDSYTLEESKNQRIDLHKNFRSREEILDFTNDIFMQIMHKSLGNVEYDDAASLYPGASYPMAEHPQMFEPLVLLADSTDEELTGLPDSDRVTMEAMMIADEIARLMENQQVTDEESGELRPLRYGDIVILLRSLSGYADEITSVLMDAGIPAHTASKTGYFVTTEVQTVLNYLRILDNPLQDIPLASVLRSPIGGFEEEDLAGIVIGADETSFAQTFFTRLQEHTLPGKVQEKADAFYQVYCRLREEVTDKTIHELLMDVLEWTNYKKIAAVMPGGRQRLANLEMLVEKAIDYEGTSYRGLFHFIRYIDQLQKYDVDFGEAELVSEQDDAVRIMSIHKSKGLEFPVVFVSGLGKMFNRQDTRSRMILHPGLGMGIDETDSERRLRIPSLLKRVIAGQGEQENLGEELRVLYVALTRAKEKLILTGVKKNAGEWLERMQTAFSEESTMTFTDIMGADSYLDWVIPAVFCYGERYPVKLVSAEELVLAEAERQTTEKQLDTEEQEWNEDGSMDAFVTERLSYQYPYQAAVDMQMKYSVSELKHRAMRALAQKEELNTVPAFLEEEIVPYVPEFMDGVADKDRISQGALRGTAVHRVLECLDFAGLNDEDLKADVTGQITQMSADGRITKEMQELVKVDTILPFLESPVGKRMREADKLGNLFREKPFVLGLEEEELVLVQGIIDVFWIEGDQVIVLDYKTDRVKDAVQLHDMYEKQLELYAQALETTTGKKVMERYLYSFHLQEIIPV